MEVGYVTRQHGHFWSKADPKPICGWHILEAWGTVRQGRTAGIPQRGASTAWLHASQVGHTMSQPY